MNARPGMASLLRLRAEVQQGALRDIRPRIDDFPECPERGVNPAGHFVLVRQFFHKLSADISQVLQHFVREPPQFNMVLFHQPLECDTVVVGELGQRIHDHRLAGDADDGLQVFGQ